jgi:hypothetical protein
MCMYEVCNVVHVCKHLYGAFPASNWLQQGDDLSPLHLILLLEYSIRKSKRIRKGWPKSGLSDYVNLLMENIYS